MFALCFSVVMWQNAKRSKVVWSLASHFFNQCKVKLICKTMTSSFILFLTFKVDKSHVFLNSIPGSQSGTINTFILLVCSHHSDDGFIVKCLNVHIAGLLQLYAWRMTTWLSVRNVPYLNCQKCATSDFSCTTISEPEDVLLERKQVWCEGTLQGETTALLYPGGWKGNVKLGFFLLLQA